MYSKEESTIIYRFRITACMEPSTCSRIGSGKLFLVPLWTILEPYHILLDMPSEVQRQQNLLEDLDTHAD
jgi:hypothetical protein